MGWEEGEGRKKYKRELRSNTVESATTTTIQRLNQAGGGYEDILKYRLVDQGDPRFCCHSLDSHSPFQWEK